MSVIVNRLGRFDATLYRKYVSFIYNMQPSILPHEKGYFDIWCIFGQIFVNTLYILILGVFFLGFLFFLTIFSSSQFVLYSRVIRTNFKAVKQTKREFFFFIPSKLVMGSIVATKCFILVRFGTVRYNACNFVHCSLSHRHSHTYFLLSFFLLFHICI